MGEDIDICNVSKAFTICHNRSHSLKSNFVGLFNQHYREQIERRWVLKQINLTVKSGSALGLIGRNGSGKSTLLRIIAGIYQPTTGRVQLPKNARVSAMIELGVGFHPDLTGKENVFLGASIHGLTRREIQNLYAAIVEFSELDEYMDIPLKNYSSGMHARLGFALSVNLNPDLLLIDEVLAVGDEAFRKKCLDKMNSYRKEGKTVILVTHDSSLIEAFCDSVCVLDHGQQAFYGSPSQAVVAYHDLLAGPPNADTTRIR